MNKIIFLLLTIIIIFAAIAFGGYFYIQKEIKTPFDLNGNDKIIKISSGESAQSIAFQLEKEKIIKDRRFFLFYLWQNKKLKNLRAGSYLLNSKLAIPEIAEIIINGKIIDESIEITIPEGLNSEQIAKILKEKGLIKNEIDFLKILKPKNFQKYNFLNQSAETIEGYLFPDTYKFKKDAGPEEIIAKMMENFKVKIIDQLFKANELNVLDAKIKDKNRNFYEIIIIASLLEKEVKSEEDMKIVSDIFWKRIDINMPLQVDATIAYITNKKTGEITYDDLEINSPFNTYLNKGLPPSPIANPGLKAIRATIKPLENKYWYYLSRPTGETIFSKTLEEHNRNKAKYL